MDKNPKNQEDEEFEKLLRDFIDNDIDLDGDPEEDEETEDHDDQYDENLPFPKPMNDRVAEIKLGETHGKKECMADIDSVQLQVEGNHVYYSDEVMRVTFQGKPGASLRPHRFSCYIYTNEYCPVCEGDEVVKIKKGRKRQLILDISCHQVWLPGQYVMIVRDSQDSCSVMRYDFTLDHHLKVKDLSAGRRCMVMSLEDTLSGCLNADNPNWSTVAHVPGSASMRMKAIQSCQMLYINEFRKEEELGELKTSPNLLICMEHPRPLILRMFQVLVTSDYQCKVVDCSTLFDPSRNNPYELLPEILDDCEMKVLCLTRLSDLIGPNGKIIMRKVIDMVRRSNGQTLLWLCGTRHEIDELLGLYPSLKQFFCDDSWVEQQPSTAYELVQAMFDHMAACHLKLTGSVKDRLARAIIQGQAEGTLGQWSSEEVRQFVEGKILPRYIGRLVAQDTIDVSPYVEMDDIPFEELTDTTSTFDESMRELKDMIGLENVKQGIMTMSNQARLFLERKRRGLKTSSPLIFHSIFTGNPGTGKTTVARKLGKIYHSLGLLSKGEVIAVDRTRLVGQYIGQTEENMKMVLEEAKGNVLFIDEAYTLNTGGDDRKDFGGRVLDSLLTVLTQPNPDMLIVFAGYPKEMDAMLATNPGLAGRFPFRYHFEDYTANQLMEIARHLLERDEYILTDEAALTMEVAIEETLEKKQANFGNARWIEQFVNNGIIPAMADRIFSTGSTDFQRIEAADITKAFEKFKPKANELKSSRHRVKGFSA